MKEVKSYNKLTTNNSFNKNNPLNYYPRPQLKRDENKSNYINLNGIWDYEIYKKDLFNINDIFNKSYNKKIVVPFAIESQLSGVEYNLLKDDILVYHLSFDYKKLNDLVLLHFGAVDQKCDVYLNNNYIGNHIGGYLPFNFEVSDYIKEHNDLYVIVVDELSHYLPYGKQRTDHKGMWYTPVSGIWKTVWIESVPNNYIKSLKITPYFDTKTLNVIINSNNNDLEGNIKIYLDKKIIKELSFNTNNINILFDDIKYWTPEDPTLYDVDITYGNDSITTYFAFRKFSVDNYLDNKVIMLNNKPYFMHGLLDQGYYPDGIYTPASLDVVEKDLKTIKELGFNTLRKHIKVEDDMWYYLCDKLGIIVWQDFVNMFPYRFFTDTIQPTILNNKGFKLNCYKKNDKEFFIKHSLEIIDSLYNHPSIALWTIFNEGWGEHDVKKVYNAVKEKDSTRLIDPYSGWFKVGNFSDFTSKHIYFRRIKFKKTSKCLILTEFGGYSLMIDGHHYSNNVYGYGGCPSIEKYNEDFKKLYLEQVVPFIKIGLSASIYTQVSDVEDEINGLMTYDRKVIKLTKDTGKIVSDALKH